MVVTEEKENSRVTQNIKTQYNLFTIEDFCKKSTFKKISSMTNFRNGRTSKGAIRNFISKGYHQKDVTL